MVDLRLGEGSECVAKEQEEGSDWENRGQGEGSKRVISMFELFQYKNKYLPIM